MGHIPAKGSISVVIEGHAVGEKREYYKDNWYRPIEVDRIVGVQSGTESKILTREIEAFVKKELKAGDRILAHPYASYLSPGAEFVLMDEKGKYELLLSGVFSPDDNNAYGELVVTKLEITKKLSGPKRLWNYLKEL